jgi:group I intron endonuclease
MIGIYKITSPSKKIYIGQSVNIKRRFSKYRCLTKTNEQPALVRSFIKYGVEEHNFEIVEECLLEELNIRERYWQEFYDVLKYGLNCTLVPTDTLPMIVSEVTRIKIGNGNRGKKLSEETKKLISKNHARLNLGKHLSDETKQKLRVRFLGKKLSEETKLKMSKLECRCKKIINTETNEIFNSIIELAGYLNITLNSLRYQLQTYKKYKQYEYYKIKEINKMKTAQEFLNTEEYYSVENNEDVRQAMKDYTLYILEYIFEDGLGNIDENCSKDDLIESYLEIKKLLER